MGDFKIDIMLKYLHECSYAASSTARYLISCLIICIQLTSLEYANWQKYFLHDVISAVSSQQQQ